MVGYRIKTIDIIKFLGACAVMLLGVLRKSEKIGEQSNDQYFQDYLNIQNTWGTTGITKNIHKSAPEETYQTICEKKTVLCQKTSFEGIFFDQEKSTYIEYLWGITDFISAKNKISPDFLKTIKQVNINNEEGNRRGYATRDTIVLNILWLEGNNEFSQLSTHELGHIFDLWFLQGKQEQKDQNFTEFKKNVFSIDDPSLYYYKISRQNESIRKSSAKKKDFCSWYGMSNPFEDFAECFNLYIRHNKLFKFIAKKNPDLGKKYNFIATLFKWTYLEGEIKEILLVKDNPNRRTWDTTKI